MVDRETSQGQERARPGRLLIVVPPDLPSRVRYLHEILAGSEIEIIIDRRRHERRRGSGQRTQDRRHRDRRGANRLFGYISGCSVVRTGPPAAG